MKVPAPALGRWAGGRKVMKTKASIMGHPVHMSLAHFPMAFLIGAFAFDVAAKCSGQGKKDTKLSYFP
jgi:hypothetical protein